jgi:hypothetical protein
MQRSRLAVACGFLGALGVFDAVLGPVLVHAGAITPFFGFRAFYLLGTLCGLVALLLSPFALRATRAASGRTGRGLAWLGFACGALLVGVVAAGARSGGGVPAINDITTNLSDPPAFPTDPAGAARDMSYPAEFVPQVQEAYPDLATLRVSSEPSQALALAEETARALGWDVVATDRPPARCSRATPRSCSASWTPWSCACAPAKAAARSSTFARSRATAAGTWA